MTEPEPNRDETPGGPLSDDERAELERLRVELADARAETQRLQAEGAGAGPPSERHPPTGRWRTPIAVLLVVLGCIFAPLALVAVWSNTTVSDTNQYVATVAPLAKEPAVQDAAATQATQAIFSRVDVEGLTRQALDAIASRLPPVVAAQVRGLSGTISNAIKGFVTTQVTNVVRSDQFSTVWVQANRVAHHAIIQALSGQGGALKVQGGVVSLDLGPFIDVVKKDLSNAGFTLINQVPAIHPTIQIFQSKDLATLQIAYQWLNQLAVLLPILAVVLLAAGVLLARYRRRMLIGAGIGVAISMLVLGLGLAIARSIYLSSIPPNKLPPDAAAAIYDTLVRFLQVQLRTFAVVALLVALGGFLVGPTEFVVRVRMWLSGAIGWLRERGEAIGLRTGAVGSWVYDHRRLLRVAVVVAIVLGFVFWYQPTVLVVLLLALILLVALAIIEFVARPPLASEPAAGTG
ncbi:hypothetical protein [Actinopolymorpha alba]|uniref:hypothetical protein n=1 Tax=Actinopolymorpha alba TaxID=533267 RepID=UPI00036F9E61|nr:hypothetical protein [Actinopolymorpha alba]